MWAIISWLHFSPFFCQIVNNFQMDWWKIEAQVCTTWVVFQTELVLKGFSLQSSHNSKVVFQKFHIHLLIDEMKHTPLITLAFTGFFFDFLQVIYSVPEFFVYFLLLDVKFLEHNFWVFCYCPLKSTLVSPWFLRFIIRYQSTLYSNNSIVGKVLGKESQLTTTL